jgi:hypothetical protein
MGLLLKGGVSPDLIRNGEGCEGRALAAPLRDVFFVFQVLDPSGQEQCLGMDVFEGDGWFGIAIYNRIVGRHGVNVLVEG